MKVETKQRFLDLDTDIIREVGEEFAVTQERFNKLSMLGLVTAKPDTKESKPNIKKE